MSKDIMLKDVRIAFIDTLWTPGDYKNDGKFKHRANFIVDPKQKAVVEAAMLEVATAEFKGKAKMLIDSIKNNRKECCFTPGDLQEYDGYVGNHVLVATRNAKDRAPLIIDRAKNPVGEKDGVIYAGCYVNAKVQLWAQNNTHGKAIRATLLAVQFCRDGDAFSAVGKASADEFDDLSTDEEGSLD